MMNITAPTTAPITAPLPLPLPDDLEPPPSTGVTTGEKIVIIINIPNNPFRR